MGLVVVVPLSPQSTFSGASQLSIPGLYMFPFCNCDIICRSLLIQRFASFEIIAAYLPKAIRQLVPFFSTVLSNKNEFCHTVWFDSELQYGKILKKYTVPFP